MKLITSFLLLFGYSLAGYTQTDASIYPAQIQYRNYENGFEKITYFGPKNEFYKVETFSKDSTLNQVVHFALLFDTITGHPGTGNEAAIRHGPVKIMYPDGQVYLEGSYRESVLDGPLTLFYGDGSLKRRALYKLGREKHSHCFDKTGQEVPCQELAERMRFTGKIHTLKHYLLTSIRPIIKHTGITGIQLDLAINELGQLTNATVKLYPDTDDIKTASAIKQVVLAMPQWTPGHLNFSPTRIDDVTLPSTWQLRLDRKRGPLSVYLPPN